MRLWPRVPISSSPRCSKQWNRLSVQQRRPEAASVDLNHEIRAPAVPPLAVRIKRKHANRMAEGRSGTAI